MIKNIPFVDLKAQYLSIKKDIDNAIKSVIQNTAFIKGKYVNDFHALNKSRIFVIVHAAVQEIDRIQQAEKTKLTETQTRLTAAEAKITTLETENAALKARLDAIETHLGL